MNWLIVEDALRDRKGHWFEWVTTFFDDLEKAGDKAVVLADSAVETDIRERLNAVPILPASIWHRMGDGSNAAIRYSRVFTHAWNTWRVMRRYFANSSQFDVVFVPTVIVHHLLAWTWLIKTTLSRGNSRVLLFFLTGPVQIDNTGKATLDGSPSAKLLLSLIKRLDPEVRAGRVILGVETVAMEKTMTELTGVPFTYFPQPVPSFPSQKIASRDGREIRMACYGAARAEKGSDILQEAIAVYRRKFPDSRASFTMQWIDDFRIDGKTVTKHPALLSDPSVHFLGHYFGASEYAGYLADTDVMLLPYRVSSYALRGSRVVIEAAVNGIPTITTQGTTLATLAERHGAGVTCVDGDVESLVDAIREVELNFEHLRDKAIRRMGPAKVCFSVDTFRQLLMPPKGDDTSSFDKSARELRQKNHCADAAA